MGAKHITPEEVIEMQRLYRVYGTYAAVAREIGRSALLASGENRHIEPGRNHQS